MKRKENGLTSIRTGNQSLSQGRSFEKRCPEEIDARWKERESAISGKKKKLSCGDHPAGGRGRGPSAKTRGSYLVMRKEKE